MCCLGRYFAYVHYKKVGFPSKVVYSCSINSFFNSKSKKSRFTQCMTTNWEEKTKKYWNAPNTVVIWCPHGFKLRDGLFKDSIEMLWIWTQPERNKIHQETIPFLKTFYFPGFLLMKRVSIVNTQWQFGETICSMLTAQVWNLLFCRKVSDERAGCLKATPQEQNGMCTHTWKVDQLILLKIYMRRKQHLSSLKWKWQDVNCQCFNTVNGADQMLSKSHLLVVGINMFTWLSNLLQHHCDKLHPSQLKPEVQKNHES